MTMLGHITFYYLLKVAMLGQITIHNGIEQNYLELANIDLGIKKAKQMGEKPMLSVVLKTFDCLYN